MAAGWSNEHEPHATMMRALADVRCFSHRQPLVSAKHLRRMEMKQLGKIVTRVENGRRLMNGSP